MEPTEAIEATTDTTGGAFDLVMTGGPVVWLLMVLSVIALTIIIYKLVQFVMLGMGKTAHVERAVQLFREGRRTEALAAVQGAKDPTSMAVATAIRGTMRPDASDALVREEVERVASVSINGLKSQLGILDLIGSLSPLLGLLGTVLGMIIAFQGVGQGVGGADTALLAAGIWEALLTTAFGLGVALPFSILAAVFNNAVDGVRDMVEDALTEILVRADSQTAKTSEG